MVSPKFNCGESCEFVFAHGSYVHQKCSNYALTNLLFGLCRSMWVIDLLVTLPSPYPRAPTHPFTLKMLRAKERTLTPHSSIVFTLDSHLNLLRSLGVCHLSYCPSLNMYLGENPLRCSTTHDEKGLVFSSVLFYPIFWSSQKIRNQKL